MERQGNEYVKISIQYFGTSTTCARETSPPLSKTLDWNFTRNYTCSIYFPKIPRNGGDVDRSENEEESRMRFRARTYTHTHTRNGQVHTPSTHVNNPPTQKRTRHVLRKSTVVVRPKKFPPKLSSHLNFTTNCTASSPQCHHQST